jgi:hypothetical protein
VRWGETRLVEVQTIANGRQDHTAFQASPNWRLLKSKKVRRNRTKHQHE